jgi:hypothetical protein
MLVRTMIQETGCDVDTKRIRWVKVHPDYEILFRPINGLQQGEGRRYWIQVQGADEDNHDIGAVMEKKGVQVKTSVPMSHNALTSVEEFVK